MECKAMIYKLQVPSNGSADVRQTPFPLPNGAVCGNSKEKERGEVNDVCSTVQNRLPERKLKAPTQREAHLNLKAENLKV